jgi:hypothetical protein
MHSILVHGGGDFLVFFTLPDGAIAVYLRRRHGKGLPAALYAAQWSVTRAAGRNRMIEPRGRGSVWETFGGIQIDSAASLQ